MTVQKKTAVKNKAAIKKKTSKAASIGITRVATTKRESNTSNITELSSQSLAQAVNGDDNSFGKNKKIQGAFVTDQKRLEMIQIEAYLSAEKRHFMNGDPLHDWLRAEVQVDKRLSEGSL
ncbi:MAG: DUF2934 domain-containing protein [Gammaproteobacteria bacterium]|nr:DUF2934 domain-containing protein [Gammaproteobacteria bacterium]